MLGDSKDGSWQISDRLQHVGVFVEVPHSLLANPNAEQDHAFVGVCFLMSPIQIILMLIALLQLISVRAAVFHYSVPTPTPKGDSTAFVWIPPQAKQIRGVVLAGMTLMEREFVRDERIRHACADEQLAILFLKCGLGAADLQQVLDDFAKVSGYRELSAAPLFFIGHSAGGPQAKAAAIKMSERCFGLVQYRGGDPGGDNPLPPSVPALMMVGQFDEFGGQMRNDAGRESWEGGRDALAAFRARDEQNLASIVVEPGAGHFAWSDRNAAYLALFIRKAAQARIPKDWAIDATTPVALKKINVKSGWLTNLAIKTSGEFPAAAYESFAGPKASAAWHFDQEMAAATVAYHANSFGKKDQFIKWNDSFSVDAGARFFFNKIQWTGDGRTFEVHPVYAENYPGQYNGSGPRWTLAGQPAGHSAAEIRVRPVSGPVVVAGKYSFRFQYDNLAPAAEGSRVTFLAFSEGDAEFRFTEHVGMLPKGFNGLKTGKTQTISFSPINNLKVGDGPRKLTASSDSGLPVEFYVAVGPAEIVNGELNIAELPARATYPITVKVIAWQFGSGVEPLVQSAKPVEQTILIEGSK